MTGLRVPLLLLLVLGPVACRGTPPGPAPAERPVPGRGFAVSPYEGNFADRRNLSDVRDAPALIEGALRRVEERLGIEGDPDRRRLFVFSDRAEDTSIATEIVAGRRIQVITVPIAPVARGRTRLPDLLLPAVARAVLSDPEHQKLPAWFRVGAPIWIGGDGERRLHERIFGGAEIELDPDRIAPPLRRERGLADLGRDELSAGLFLRFIAEEFGADRVRMLSSAFERGEDDDQALAAALSTHPASLPIAYEGWRRRLVSGIINDPHVRLLAEVAYRSPTERVIELSGLADRAPNPWVGAAILSELWRAQYEAGDYAGAGETLARIDREFAPFSPRPARERLLFALSFARRNEDRAALLRLTSFVEEYPGHPETATALKELADLATGQGLPAEAERRLRELLAEYPESDAARQAAFSAADRDIEAGRYSAARGWLVPLSPGPDVTARLDTIRKTEASPQAGRRAVVAALRDMASPSEQDGERGIRAVGEIGTPAAARLLEILERTGDGAVGSTFLRRRARFAADRLPEAEGTSILLALLADPDANIAAQALSALYARGYGPGEVLTRRAEGGRPVPTRVRELIERVPIPGGREGPELEARADEVARLSLTDDPADLPRLIALSRDSSSRIRGAAIRALARRSGPAAWEAVGAGLDDPSVDVRMAAIRSHAGRDSLTPVRLRGVTDPDSRVRTAAAEVLLTSDDPRDLEAVVARLDDEDGGVAASVEALLRSRAELGVAPVLANALTGNVSPGAAMRIVRVIADVTGSDFGYDPTGGPEERHRVAGELRAVLSSDRER